MSMTTPNPHGKTLGSRLAVLASLQAALVLGAAGTAQAAVALDDLVDSRLKFCPDVCPVSPPPSGGGGCTWSTRNVVAAIATTGPGGGTEVSLDLDYRYGCAGGPQVTGTTVLACSWTSNWANSDCDFDPPTLASGNAGEAGSGSFTCLNAACGSGSSHTLFVEIEVDNSGGLSCEGSHPSSMTADLDCNWS